MGTRAVVEVLRSSAMAKPAGPSSAAHEAYSRSPIPASRSVSLRMSKVRTTDTGPERRLRILLHARGHRYRLGYRPVASVRCYPDILFVRAKVAVFVDGCFWHGCPEHASWPKSNAEWWRRKIARTRARDIFLATTLSEAGWLVLRIWEHQDPEEAADLVELALDHRIGRSVTAHNPWSSMLADGRH